MSDAVSQGIVRMLAERQYGMPESDARCGNAKMPSRKLANMTCTPTAAKVTPGMATRIVAT
jgi:hypothetical protein